MRRQYLLEGYSYSFEPEVLVTEFSTRNRRQRSLYQKRNTVFNVSEKLNITQLAEFEEWINVTLRNGADSFIGSYWDGDVERTGTLNIIDGYYTFDHQSSKDITVSYQIETQNRDMTQAAAIYQLYLGGAPFYEQYYNVFERMVNLNNFS